MKKVSTQTLIICIALFFFFLYLSFPFQNLKGYIFGKIYSQTNIHINAEDMSPTLLGWPGIVARKVVVTVPVSEKEIVLEAEKLVVRVGLGSIFPPAPSISLKFVGMKQGGDVYVKLIKSSKTIKAKFWAEDLNVVQALPANAQDVVKGKIDGDGALEIENSQLNRSKGQVRIEAKNLQLASVNLQGFFLPAVQLNGLRTRVNIHDGSADIVESKFGDASSDIQGTLSGQLRLGSDLMNSHANITLRTQVSPKFKSDPKAVSILSFLDGYYKAAGNNAYAMKWNGTLEEISTRTPLPQKLIE